MSASATTPIDLPHRSVPEWIGKTPDSRPPNSVKLRVFARYQGRCYLSGRKIGPADKWDVEHVRPLHTAQPDENLNRETNLAPALKQPHAEKTARENSAKAKADRIRLKNAGLWRGSGRKLQSRNTFKERRPAHG